MPADIRRIKKALPYVDRLNPRYSANVSAEEKRKRAEQFETLNRFVIEHGGWIVSPTNQMHVRIEVRENSALPVRLVERGFSLRYAGTGTRPVFGGTTEIRPTL